RRLHPHHLRARQRDLLLLNLFDPRTRRRHHRRPRRHVHRRRLVRQARPAARRRADHPRPTPRTALTRTTLTRPARALPRTAGTLLPLLRPPARTALLAPALLPRPLRLLRRLPPRRRRTTHMQPRPLRRPDPRGARVRRRGRRLRGPRRLLRAGTGRRR